jgi:hypothetical protein
MKDLFNSIPEKVKSIKQKKYSKNNQKELKLNNLHGVSQSLDDIEELINVEEEFNYSVIKNNK